MPRLNVQAITGETLATHTVASGATFFDEARRIWPQGIGAGGKPPTILDARTGAELDVSDAVSRPMEPGEVYTIVVNPADPGTLAAISGFLSQSFLGISYGHLLLTAVSLIAVAALAPKLNAPQAYDWDEDENPQRLSGQTNQFRPGQRVPDLFGCVRDYPDLIAPAVVDANAADFRLDELYVITNGAADLTDLKLDDQAIEDLPASQVDYFGPDRAAPFDKWPVDFPIMRQNNFVGDIDLIAPNEEGAGGRDWQWNTNGTITVDDVGYWNDFLPVGAWFMPTTRVSNANRKPYEIVSKSPDGKVLTVTPAPTVTETADRITIREILSMAGTPQNPNTVVVAFSFRVDVTPGPRWASQNLAAFPAGEYTRLVRVSDQRETPITRGQANPPSNAPVFIAGTNPNNPPDANGQSYLVSWGDEGSYNPNTPGSGLSSGVMNVPGTVSEIWLDFDFPQGLYFQRSGLAPQPRAVAVDVFYRRRDVTPAPAFQSMRFEMAAQTRNPVQYTRKVTGLDPGQYEVYVSRVTDANLETGASITMDATRWVRLLGRQVASDLENLPLTYTMVRLRLTSQSVATITQNRRFNCIAKRKLPDHANNAPGTLVQTDTIRDAILYTLIEQANYARAQIDLVGLNAVHADLVAIEPDAAKFNGIVDQTMTADDQLLALGEVGRVTMFRRGQRVYFRRTGAGTAPTTLFNARNKMAPEEKTLVYSEASDPDAIIVRFSDAAQGYTERSITYPAITTPRQPIEISLLGVTSASVAYRRARYEWDKRRLQKDSVTCQVTEEGLLLDPGDVFAMTDALREETPFEGEIVAVSGTDYTFDQPIPPGTFISTLRDKWGAIAGRYERVFTGTAATRSMGGWGTQTMPDAPAQLGLLYTLTPVADAPGDLWIAAQFEPSEDDTGALGGVRFNPAVFAADDPDLPIPTDPTKREGAP